MTCTGSLSDLTAATDYATPSGVRDLPEDGRAESFQSSPACEGTACSQATGESFPSTDFLPGVAPRDGANFRNPLESHHSADGQSRSMQPKWIYTIGAGSECWVSPRLEASGACCGPADRPPLCCPLQKAGAQQMIRSLLSKTYTAAILEVSRVGIFVCPALRKIINGHAQR